MRWIGAASSHRRLARAGQVFATRVWMASHRGPVAVTLQSETPSLPFSCLVGTPRISSALMDEDRPIRFDGEPNGTESEAPPEPVSGSLKWWRLQKERPTDELRSDPEIQMQL